VEYCGSYVETMAYSFSVVRIKPEAKLVTVISEESVFLSVSYAI